MKNNFLPRDKYLARFNEIQKLIIPITRQLGQSIELGMNEQEIADEYLRMLADANLVNHWYPILINAGKNSGKALSRRIHLPDRKTIIRENDIVVLDCTPIDKTVWGNWAETFIIGKNPFYQALADDCLKIVQQTASFTKTSAKTVGEVLDYCIGLAIELKMTSLDSRNDVGHSIFQVPEGQTVEKTSLGERLFLNEDYRDTQLSGIVSIEPHFGRINPHDGLVYGSKQQEIVIFS